MHSRPWPGTRVPTARDTDCKSRCCGCLLRGTWSYERAEMLRRSRTMLVFDSPFGPERMGRAALHMRFRITENVVCHTLCIWAISGPISSRMQLRVFMQDPVSLRIPHPGPTIPFVSSIFLAPPLQISSQELFTNSSKTRVNCFLIFSFHRVNALTNYE